MAIMESVAFQCMVNVLRLLVFVVLASTPLALYNFWFRHTDWTRTQKWYKTFGLLSAASGVVVFSDSVLQMPELLELGALGFAIVTLVLTIHFARKVRRNQPA